MNFMGSECSSGCESGWTLYFEQSVVSGFEQTKVVCGNAKGKRSKVVDAVTSDEEEEDLSMVSDASSGPPHFHEDESLYGQSRYVSEVKPNSKRQYRKKEHQHRQQEHEKLSFLDDTASSPIMNFSQNNVGLNNKQASMESVLDYSQGFSATEFEQGRPIYQNHYDFFQSSSLSGNQMQRNQWY